MALPDARLTPVSEMNSLKSVRFLQAVARVNHETGPERPYFISNRRRIDTTPDLLNKKANLYMIVEAD
jgi:hypothetical protein